MAAATPGVDEKNENGKTFTAPTGSRDSRDRARAPRPPLFKQPAFIIHFCALRSALCATLPDLFRVPPLLWTLFRLAASIGFIKTKALKRKTPAPRAHTSTHEHTREETTTRDKRQEGRVLSPELPAFAPPSLSGASGAATRRSAACVFLESIRESLALS